MRVALVFCPFGSNNEQPPVGITHVAANLGDAHQVDLFDLSADFRAHCKEVGDEFFAREAYDYKMLIDLEEMDLDQLEIVREYAADKAKLLAADYDIVGFSLFAANLNFSHRLISEIKRRDPATLVVAGGPSCDLAAAAREIMAFDYPTEHGPRHLVDAAVVGEGERTFRRLVDAVAAGEDFRDLPGVLTDRGATPVLVENSEPCELDALPYPDYSLYDLDRYTDTIIPLVTSRGCIYRCRYCSEHGLWGPFRSRSAESMLAEIRFHLERCNIPCFHFTGSLFNGDIKQLSRLCDLIIESGLEFGWYGLAAIRKEMDQALAAKMRASGCIGVNYGLESGSDRLLEDMGKRYDSALASRVLAASKQAGFRVGAYLFVGYPTETEADLAATFEFLRDNRQNLDELHFTGTCRVGPLSYLRNHMAEMGIVGYGDWWHLTDGTSTPEIRADRARRLEAFCMDLGLLVQ